MIEILCFVIIALLIVAILLLLFRKPKSTSEQQVQAAAEQNVKMETLNNSMQNLAQLNSTQLQNMSGQLNNLYQSLGEMKTMSSNVEDLKKVLANVKSRGAFAEVQLERLLELTIRGQYEKNVKPNPRASKIVEFAIKVPNGKEGGVTWLPVDSKFPLDRYAALVKASEGGDSKEVEVARKSLIAEIDRQATKIKDGYIAVPYTTNFAIMYLATEGMYMEAVTDPDGLQYKLQERGIMLAGPSTILALLNSLSMGFNMVKINENADEIRKLLGDIKRQFDDFNSHFKDINDGLTKAEGALRNARNRSDLITKKLDTIDFSDED